MMDKKDLQLASEYRLALDFYLQILSSQNKSEHTLTNYRQDLRRFLSWYQQRYGLSLKHLRPQMISEYQHFMIGGGPIRSVTTWRVRWVRLTSFWRKLPQLEFKKSSLGPNSRRRNMSCLHNFFTILVESSYFKNQFKENPIRPNLHRIKVKETDIEPTLVLSPKDWEKLDHKTWRPKDRLLIHLLYYGGLRLSEVAGLKISALDCNQRILQLERKGGKRHRLNLWKGALIASMWRAYIERAHKENAEDAPLFPGRKGKHLSPRGLSKRIKHLLRKAELNPKLGPHSFRKGCATALYQKTKDLLYVRDYLNHTDAKVTQTYIDQIGIGRGQAQ